MGAATMQIVLFSAFLLQLTLSTATDAFSSTLSLDTESARQMETKQCLMQKKHELARTSQSASSELHDHKNHDEGLPPVKGLSLAPGESSPQSGKTTLHANERSQHKDPHQKMHQRENNLHVERSLAEKGRKTKKTRKSHKVGDNKLRTRKNQKHEVSTGSPPSRSTKPIDGNDKKNVRESSWDKTWKKAVEKDARRSHQQRKHRHRSEDDRHASRSLGQKDAKTKQTRKSHNAGNHKLSTHKNHAHHKNDAHKTHRKPSSDDHKLKTDKNHRHHKKNFHKELASASLVQMDKESSKKPTSLLPSPILALARTLFKDDDAIAHIVENSVLVNVKYAGEQMSLRINKADDATRRLGEEGQWFSYDLDTLNELPKNPDDGLNMLDVGGNLGVVTIAAFKKHSKSLRVITLEPIPMTYFFLRWNLYLNGVPELDQAALDAKSKAPGVFALNRGSSDVEGQDLHFCFDPKSSMNSRICECKQGEEHCIIVPSVTVDNLAGMFGNEPIAMVKMDCEGCEFKSLPALATAQIAKRVLRLAGELHLPDKNLEDIACRWDHGRLLTKCQHSKKEHPVYEIECDMPLECPQ